LWRRTRAIKRASPKERPAISIIFREQNCRGRTVSLRDDPELDAGRGMIDGQDPRAFNQSLIVGLPVVFAHVTPITRLMPLQPAQYIILRQMIKRIVGSDDAVVADY